MAQTSAFSKANLIRDALRSDLAMMKLHCSTIGNFVAKPGRDTLKGRLFRREPFAPADPIGKAASARFDRGGYAQLGVLDALDAADQLSESLHLGGWTR